MSCSSSLDMSAAPSGVNIADTRGLTQFTDTTVKTSFTSLVGLNSASRTVDHNPQGAMLPWKLQGLVWWQSKLYFFFFFFSQRYSTFANWCQMHIVSKQQFKRKQYITVWNSKTFYYYHPTANHADLKKKKKKTLNSTVDELTSKASTVCFQFIAHSSFWKSK